MGSIPNSIKFGMTVLVIFKMERGKTIIVLFLIFLICISSVYALRLSSRSASTKDYRLSLNQNESNMSINYLDLQSLLVGDVNITGAAVLQSLLVNGGANITGTAIVNKLLVADGSFDVYNIADIYSNNLTTINSYITSGSAAFDYAARIGANFNNDEDYYQPAASSLVLTSSTSDGKDYYFVDPLYIEKVEDNGGTITSIAGIYIEAQDAATDNWAIAVNNDVYIDGGLKIDPAEPWFDPTDTPSMALDVTGNMSVNGAVALGIGASATATGAIAIGGPCTLASWSCITNPWLYGVVNNFVTFEADNDLFIEGDVNITGNITGSRLYGEMWNKNDDGFVTVNLITPDAYVQIDNLNAGSMNGVSLENTANLTVASAGMYNIKATFSATAGGNGEFGFKIYVNGAGQNDCYAHGKVATGGAVPFGIDCLVSLSAGDNVGLYVDDHANPVNDPTIKSANINLVNIG